MIDRKRKTFLDAGWGGGLKIGGSLRYYRQSKISRRP